MNFKIKTHCEITFSKTVEVIKATKSRTVIFHAHFSKPIFSRSDRGDF